MINNNENEAENVKQIPSILRDRHRPKHGHENVKYKMCLSIMIYENI